jgi:hypothetical protein
MPSDIPTKNLGPPRIPTNIPTKNYVVFIVLVPYELVSLGRAPCTRADHRLLGLIPGSRVLFSEYIRDSLRRCVLLHILTTWVIIIIV